MEPTNVELVRSIFAAWERGDYSSAEWAHPEIEYTYADGPAPGTWIGVAGMAGEAWEWLSAWDDFRLEAYDYQELDSERILVSTRFSGRGKTSGLELEQMPTRGGVWLVQIRDGKVIRLVRYFDRERAFAELGLGTAPSEKLDVVRRAIEAFNERDMEAIRPLLDEEFEFSPYLTAMIESKVYRGPEAMVEYFKDADAVWETIQVRMHEVRELSDRVVASGELSGRGRTSGVDVRVPLAWMFEFERGRLKRAVVRASLSEALDASGTGAAR